MILRSREKAEIVAGAKFGNQEEFIMNRERHTGSAMGIGLVVLAVLVVGGGIWYFTSDVFKTKFDSNFNQMTTWTPENIAKDPQNYLNYVEAETTKALESLKASKIAVAQNRSKLESMRSDAKNAITVGEKAMAELLAQYKSAESNNAFPVSWNNQSLDKDRVKLQVVSLNKQVSTQKILLAKVEGGLKSLDAQVGKIDEADANAKSQLAEIRTNRELLKVQSLTTDLKDKLVSMQSAVAATVGAASENSGVVSLDQLTAESSQQVDSTEFDKILANTK